MQSDAQVSDQQFVLSRHADAKCVKNDTFGFYFVVSDYWSPISIGNGTTEDAAWMDAAKQVRRWEEILRND